jgi:SAM-dependent methyltransferase
MSSRNEVGFLKKFLAEYPMDKWVSSLSTGRVLNIGAANDKFHSQYMTLMGGKPVVNVDIVKDNGVDVVCNMEGDCGELSGERFAVVLCCSVLEHVPKPWALAANIQRHLMPFGLLYVTVPWVWRTHEYPKDYWRMSPDAIKSLFPAVRWKRSAHSTQLEDEFLGADADHDQKPPWRITHRGRAHIAVQMTHMIGRMY